MSIEITTWEGKNYIVSDAAGDVINAAMANGYKHIRLSELNATISVSDIRSMNSARGDSVPPHRIGSGQKRGGFELPPDFYSEEAMAKRRAENKIKYAPQQFQSHRSIPVEVNQSVEMGDYRLEKK